MKGVYRVMACEWARTPWGEREWCGGGAGCICMVYLDVFAALDTHILSKTSREVLMT